MKLEELKHNGNFSGISLIAETDEEQLHLDSLVHKISRAIVGKRIKLFCVQNKEYKALQVFSLDKLNLSKTCAIDAAQPFSVFTDGPDGQWAWIADYSDPDEYAYLNDLFLYLISHKDKGWLPKTLQTIGYDELTEIYQKRFQVMFGKAIQEIGKAIETERIKITPQFPKRD